MSEDGTAEPGSDEYAQAEINLIKAMQEAGKVLGTSRVAEMGDLYDRGEFRD